VVSLKGIHNASLDLSKQPKPAAAAAEADPPVRPVKVRRLDGREDEIDPTIGSTFVMPRLAHPEKLVSNKAEALRKFAERKRREGVLDERVEELAKKAAAEAAAKKAKEEEARRAALAARPKWRNVGPGRVVNLSGAEPTRRTVTPAGAPAAATAAQQQQQQPAPRIVRLGSSDTGRSASPAGRTGDASKPSVLNRLGGKRGAEA